MPRKPRQPQPDRTAPRPDRRRSESDLDVAWSRTEIFPNLAPGPQAKTGNEPGDDLGADGAHLVGRRRALTTASHEIRTPLAAIVGLADLLVAEPLTPAQSALARGIGVSGRALLSLVDDLLDLSRADLGRLRLAPEPTPLAAFLEDVVELIAPRAHAKGLELALTRIGPWPATVTVDAGRLRQVLLNLLGNAVKFTMVGGVELAVAAAPRRRGIVRLDIAVTDTGPGIAAADQARIFTAFEQADGAGAARREGVGLGLALCRAIVDAMGGAIHLDSVPGEGARFGFRLDLPAKAAPPAGTELAGRAILVLAPGRFEPAAWRRGLSAAGAAATLAETVWDARRALAAGRFDLLVVDQSPSMNAIAALNDIGSERPPAVVALGPADRPALPRYVGAGFVGHLIKPIRHASLARVLSRIVAAQPLEVAATGAPALARLPLSVLVAEDDDISALLARTLLLRLGARPEIVADGAAAVAAWTAAIAAGRPHDLALIDQQLPGLDGPATIAALRAAPGGAALRIVAVTADPSAETAQAARAAGADLCLVKPLDVDALIEIAG